ncbi:glycosyltransferase [Flavobacterium sp. SM2513]|uniref:glycosyltransferase n=1 Tax=Flavobacterium sp. SM2513 TaxID=3424766 RepID=UPI003D7F5880
MEIQRKNILVAPLNWGLGHATRCIPIIKKLQELGFTPIIASDGEALQLLKLEFPHLKFLKLPSYTITYPKKGKNFRWKMVQNIPNMILAMRKERELVKKWIAEFKLHGIISDNRLGVYSPKVPSAFITHQLNVLTGSTTFFSTKIHQKIINKFTECWVPDVADEQNLSGKLGHLNLTDLKIKYIGPLSRFRKTDTAIKYDLLVLLSGPEPQRTILEEKLILELKNYAGKVIFVKGKMEQKQEFSQVENILFYNFMQSGELEKTINESELVLCRSGYTTIMDLAKLGKKAFFIPTPGQFEQEYLAEKFQKEGLIPFCNQEDFSIEKLNEVQNHKGLSNFKGEVNWQQLFSLFERE